MAVRSNSSRGVVGRPVAWGCSFLALVLAHLGWTSWQRRADDLGGAEWIGRMEAARAGKPATVLFSKEFTLGAATGPLRFDVRADRGYRWSLDGIPAGTGGGEAGAAVLDRWRLAPLGAGTHRIEIGVTHPTGVASLRARLLDLGGSGGGGEKEMVVTGRTWEAGDDSGKPRDGVAGSKGGKPQTAAVWGKGPFSSLSAPARSIREISVSGSVPAGAGAESSRMAARDAAQ